MSIRATISAVAVALAALLLVALAPTGAAAHVGAPHVHAAQHMSDGALKPAAGPAQAELRAQAPALPGDRTDTNCDRGCCNAGHCSGCGTALPPAEWIGLRPASNIRLLDPDSSLPASLAREGPPRPPKFFA